MPLFGPDSVYANYMGPSVLTDANLEGFPICDDRITENDLWVIKVIGIHCWLKAGWFSYRNGKMNWTKIKTVGFSKKSLGLYDFFRASKFCLLPALSGFGFVTIKTSHKNQ